MLTVCRLRTLCSQQQTQYLHQFVLHASLDAVDEQMWLSKEPHLKVGLLHHSSASVLASLAACVLGPIIR